MRTYSLRFRRLGFLQRWWTVKGIAGHGYDIQTDRLALHFPDGSVMEIPRFSNCFMTAGMDLFLANKEAEEKKAGVTLKTNEVTR